MTISKEIPDDFLKGCERPEDPIDIATLLSGLADQIDASQYEQIASSGERTCSLGIPRQLQKAGNNVSGHLLSLA